MATPQAGPRGLTASEHPLGNRLRGVLSRDHLNPVAAGHPYHHIPIGSMADLDAVTLDDARAFFRANYAPDNAVLAVVGDIDPEQTRRWVEKYFGSIPSCDGKVPPRDSTLPDIIGAGAP